ncbi:MAG: galactose oxidase [Balneolaceae bacterium]|nr:galactose oxidase [Balneolaceae bacterium]
MKRLTFLLPLLILTAACNTQQTKNVKLEWSEATPLPLEISNNAVVSAEVNGELQLFTFLGLKKGKTYADVTDFSAAYDAGQKVWEQIPSVPDSIGRLASTAQTAGGDIYIFGGYTVDEDGNEVSTPEVFKFDPESYTYEEVAEMLIPVEDAVSLVYKDRYIYLVSGWHNTNNVSNVQVYDTQTNSWDHATPYPGPPVFGHAGGIAGNTMILSDGVEAKVIEGEKIFRMSPGSLKGEIDAEDHTSINWTRIKQHPGNARYRMAAIGIESPVEMVIFAGGTPNPYNFNGIGYNSRPSFPDSTVFAYRLDTNEWVTLSSQPVATMDHRGIAKAGDEYYIIGGMNENQKVINLVQKFVVK